MTSSKDALTVSRCCHACAGPRCGLLPGSHADACGTGARGGPLPPCPLPRPVALAPLPLLPLSRPARPGNPLSQSPSPCRPAPSRSLARRGLATPLSVSPPSVPPPFRMEAQTPERTALAPSPSQPAPATATPVGRMAEDGGPLADATGAGQPRPAPGRATRKRIEPSVDADGGGYLPLTQPELNDPDLPPPRRAPVPQRAARGAPAPSASCPLRKRCVNVA
jgi:hypothetical protein